MSNAEKVERTFGKIMIDTEKGIYTSAFQKKHTESVILKQEVVTLSWYPSVKIGNSLTKGLFEQEELGLSDEPYESKEMRVAFLNVPVGTSLSVVEERLAAIADKARIYRILSNKPILTDEQKSAIRNGITTLETIANSQVARYPKGNDKEGQLVLDTNGKVQYRTTFFHADGKEDVDMRTADENDVYMTDEIREELNGDFITVNHEGEQILSAQQDV